MAEKEIEIDNSSTFKANLSNGINLFTGAGFSVLPDSAGSCLPTSQGLAEEISIKFGVALFGDINKTFGIAMDKYGSDVQEFLRKRFKVNTCNQKYLTLSKIKIESFFTTNYDNIPHLIMENDSEHYLWDIGNKGSLKEPKIGIPFIPLHGSVESNESEQLTVGDLQISAVKTERADMFGLLSKKIKSFPTLFWGYKLKDDSVNAVLSKVMNEDSGVRRKIWILFNNEKDEAIEYYRSLGCNAIIGDTCQLLDWIEKNIQKEHISYKKDTSILEDPLLKKRLVPEKEKAISVTTEDYYVRGVTEWLPIYTDVPIIRHYVAEAQNMANGGMNVILLGERFSGKTTILMQIARITDCKYKFFFDSMNLSEAEYIIKKVNGTEVWIFLENCTNDANVFIKLSEHKNIHVVSTATHISFDSAKHLFKETLRHCIIDVGELTEDEARSIYNKIPKKVRKSRFSYKSPYGEAVRRERSDGIMVIGDSNDEKIMMLELLSKNVMGILTESKVGELLKSIEDKSPDIIELIALATYLSWRGSALSTDVLMVYYGYTTAEQVEKIIHRANSSLTELDNTHLKLEGDEIDQDYYILRSGLFLLNSRRIFERKNSQYKTLQSIYAKTVEHFVREVAPIHVYNYDIFKRSAFDGQLFYNLFDDNADELYDFLDQYKGNPYIFHQWALYNAELKQYKKAFILIDKALRIMPKNFSMQNSKATMMFNSNKDGGTEYAIQTMKDAMGILESCFRSDRRQNYHVETYVRFSMEFADRGHPEYLNQASEWIDKVPIHGKNKLKERLEEYRIRYNVSAV